MRTSFNLITVFLGKNKNVFFRLFSSMHHFILNFGT